MNDRYQGVVIGAGQAGGPLAQALANAGWKMALVERDRVGGSCVNWGCTPTKTLIASARVAMMANRAEVYGVHVSNVRVDFGAARERKDKIVAQFRGRAEDSALKTANLDLIYGEARFEAEKDGDAYTITLTDHDGQTRTITAEHVFINTGARAAKLDVEGIDTVRVLNEESLMNLDTLPEHLIIIGGGYLSLEFGQMFCRFGSRVTIIEAGSALMSGREDDDIASAMRDVLREDGIEVLLDAQVRRVDQLSDRVIRVAISIDGTERRIEGSHLLVAVGRTPNSDMLNLKAVGVAVDEKGHIVTNERLETAVPRIYALGDVKGGAMFTHISYDDYRIVENQILGDKSRSTRDRLTPYTVFTDPQLGRVGMTEKQAREKYGQIKVASMPMTSVARAIEMGETRGIMKAVINAEDDQILGCAFLGIEGGELMSAVQIAMMGKLPYLALKDGVFAHPTLAESLNNLFTTLE